MGLIRANHYIRFHGRFCDVRFMKKYISLGGANPANLPLTHNGFFFILPPQKREFLSIIGPGATLTPMLEQEATPDMISAREQIVYPEAAFPPRRITPRPCCFRSLIRLTTLVGWHRRWMVGVYWGRPMWRHTGVEEGNRYNNISNNHGGR